MRVCFLAGTLGAGGAERQLVFMLRALKSEGVKTRLLCLTKGEFFENEVLKTGVDIEWVGRSALRPARLLKIIKAVTACKYDILQSSHYYTNFYAGVVSKYIGVKSLGAIRNDLTSELRANPVFGRWHLRLPDHILANSKVGMEKAISLGIAPERIDLLQNVVEVSGWACEKPSKPGMPLNFLFAGRLVKEKRPDLFIDLAARLCREFPKRDIRFMVMGDGPLRQDLVERARQSGLTDVQIAFLGRQENVEQIYQETDVLILTSSYEGTPNVILEAMAHGIPVIATRVGGVPDIINEDRGIVVDPSGFDQLVSAAKRLIGEPSLRQEMGQNGRAHVEKNHSITTLGTNLIDVYSRLLRRGREC